MSYTIEGLIVDHNKALKFNNNHTKSRLDENLSEQELDIYPNQEFEYFSNDTPL